LVTVMLGDVLTPPERGGTAQVGCAHSCIAFRRGKLLLFVLLCLWACAAVDLAWSSK
jgi:hypothetical protein